MPEIAFYIGLKNNRSAIEGAELDKGAKFCGYCGNPVIIQ